MSISLKEAALDDVPAILEMMAAFNAIDNYPFDKNLTLKNLKHFISTPNLGRLWIIYDSNVVAGYMVLAFAFSFEYKGRDAFIDEIYLKDEFRNKGIGKLAMSFVEQQAKSLGVKTLHLEVEQHNARANKIYIDQGFANNGRMLLTKKL
jgi:ribosomal protein S18 acetylase RimI-like enzyme